MKCCISSLSILFAMNEQSSAKEIRHKLLAHWTTSIIVINQKKEFINAHFVMGGLRICGKCHYFMTCLRLLILIFCFALFLKITGAKTESKPVKTEDLE